MVVLYIGEGLLAGDFQVRNPIPLINRLVSRLVRVKSVEAECPFVWRGSLEMGIPAEESSSSFDQGSKLRGPSQNSLRVASERNVNISHLHAVA
ncbi:hypothetical protein AVEN_110652-1 [Araneus ventricosus]|uniref:Uncharacterized protein n=1 Tax=Araneus ventricosus TaxID=182803 RepID=A0A4Y2AUY8_ARAVE|nr:hypothetical protein AVEN_110652-1 [Araneus ventricosus]